MTDRAELIARIKQILPTRPSWTLVEYEQAVIAALEAKPEPAKPKPKESGVYDVQSKAQREWWNEVCGALEMTGHQHMREIESVLDFKPIKPFGFYPDYTAHKPEPAKPLPESVEQWIQKRKACPLEVPRFQDVLYVGDVIDYLTALHSQHQAELAAAKEQGRREALQAVPELAIEAVADFVVVNISQHTNADFRKRAIEGVRWLRALIESARDAQEGGGG